MAAEENEEQTRDRVFQQRRQLRGEAVRDALKRSLFALGGVPAGTRAALTQSGRMTEAERQGAISDTLKQRSDLVAKWMDGLVKQQESRSRAAGERDALVKAIITEVGNIEQAATTGRYGLAREEMAGRLAQQRDALTRAHEVAREGVGLHVLPDGKPKEAAKQWIAENLPDLQEIGREGGGLGDEQWASLAEVVRETPSNQRFALLSMLDQVASQNGTSPFSGAILDPSAGEEAGVLPVGVAEGAGFRQFQAAMGDAPLALVRQAQSEQQVQAQVQGIQQELNGIAGGSGELGAAAERALKRLMPLIEKTDAAQEGKYAEIPKLDTQVFQGQLDRLDAVLAQLQNPQADNVRELKQQAMQSPQFLAYKQKQGYQDPDYAFRQWMKDARKGIAQSTPKDQVREAISDPTGSPENAAAMKDSLGTQPATGAAAMTTPSPAPAAKPTAPIQGEDATQETPRELSLSDKLLQKANRGATDVLKQKARLALNDPEEGEQAV